MANFWKTLPKPFLVQAPLEQVSDTVFRDMLTKAGRADVHFTEFTNVDGLCSPGAEKVKKRLLFTATQRPIVGQIWGLKPENFLASAKLLNELGFDGIDINMGCPDRDVIKKGCCAALIEDHVRAKEIISATQEGAGDLPVSVKTRIGIRSIKTEEWISFLLEHNLSALTVHGRTVSEMSKVPAHWDEIGKAVQIRNGMKKDTVVIGNGDILSRQQAHEMHEKYGVDGIMIGRGIFQNFWVFNNSFDPETFTTQERLEFLAEHVRQYDQTWGDTKDFNILKKFFKVYIHGFDGASDMRDRFMQCKTAEETLTLVADLQTKV